MSLSLLAAGAQTPGLVLFALAGAVAFGFALTFSPPTSDGDEDDHGRGEDPADDPDGPGPGWAAFDEARRQWAERRDHART